MTEQVAYRTDRNNNPTAFTTDLAKEAGLVEGKDYVQGDPFYVGKEVFYTARLQDCISTTIQVIDRLGFFTKEGHPRWIYLQIESALWKLLTPSQKKAVIGIMYKAEGGVAMWRLFA